MKKDEAMSKTSVQGTGMKLSVTGMSVRGHSLSTLYIPVTFALFLEAETKLPGVSFFPLK